MSEQSPYVGEKARLYWFLRAALDAAVEGATVSGADLFFDHFEYLKESDYGLILSNTVGQPAYGPGDQYREFDVRLIVTAYRRIAGPERAERVEADAAAYGLAMAVARLIDDAPSLGDDGAGCTALTRVGALIGDVDESLTTGQRHAVYNLYVTINHNGGRLPSPWSLD